LYVLLAYLIDFSCVVAILANIITFHTDRNDQTISSFGRNAGHTSYVWDNEIFNNAANINSWMNDVLITHEGDISPSYYYGYSHGSQIIPLKSGAVFDAQLAMGKSGSGTLVCEA
jgi:hypothetical protein